MHGVDTQHLCGTKEQRAAGQCQNRQERITRRWKLGGCENRADDAHGEEETEDIGLHHEMAAIEQYCDEIG